MLAHYTSTIPAKKAMTYRITILTYIKLLFLSLDPQMHLLCKLHLLVPRERTGGAAVCISTPIADSMNRICYDLRNPITMDWVTCEKSH